MSASVQAEHTRVTYPNALSVELFGRGLMYTIQFDRVIQDDLVVGMGYGHVALRTVDDVDTGQNASIIPAYVNYYLMRDQGSLFVTAGMSIIGNSDQAKDRRSKFGDVEFSSAPVLPHFGVGYEVRSDTGFLFRGTAYGMIAKKFAPWVGFALGYGF